MNMQTVGTAMPVMLVQTESSGDGKTRKDFPSDRAFVKYLLKKEKASQDKDKKPDDKKKRTFTYLELFAILAIASFPVALFQVGLGYAVVKVFKILATQ